MEIQIDVSDWEDEVKRNESIITGEDELFKQVDDGQSTGKIARSAIISRELGHAPDDIIKSNKILIQSGAQVNITQKIVRKTHKVTTENGATYNSRSYVGRVKVDDEDNGADDGPSFVAAHSEEAIDRAKSYLENAVPGHIWKRLLLIYENGGAPGISAALLYKSIDEMIERLK